MTFWEVHLTLRDERGGRKRESCGVFSLDRLPAALEEAFQRALDERGGVQITRPRQLTSSASA